MLSVDPHAGEHGVIGTIDDSVVLPAIELARASEYNVDGPHPADGCQRPGDIPKTRRMALTTT